LVRFEDTALAAKDLASGKISSSGAVISRENCAHLYGLEIMAKNIEDHQPNLTAFIVVKNHAAKCHPE
jgi:prephenate dehydratase